MGKLLSCFKKAVKEVEELEPEVEDALKLVMNKLSPALIASAKSHVAKQQHEQIASVLIGVQPELSNIALTSVNNANSNSILKSQIAALAPQPAEEN